MLEGDKIQKHFRREVKKSESTGDYFRNYIFVCWNCQKDIMPSLKIQVGERDDREPEYTSFLHPINIRYNLEELL